MSLRITSKGLTGLRLDLTPQKNTLFIYLGNGAQWWLDFDRTFVRYSRYMFSYGKYEE